MRTRSLTRTGKTNDRSCFKRGNKKTTKQKIARVRKVVEFCVCDQVVLYTSLFTGGGTTHMDDLKFLFSHYATLRDKAGNELASNSLPLRVDLIGGQKYCVERDKNLGGCWAQRGENGLPQVCRCSPEDLAKKIDDVGLQSVTVMFREYVPSATLYQLLDEGTIIEAARSKPEIRRSRAFSSQDNRRLRESRFRQDQLPIRRETWITSVTFPYTSEKRLPGG
jgi:hypothetical protein